jgi:hypothetical protein
MNELILNRTLDFKRELETIKLSLQFEYLEFDLDIDYTTRQTEELYVDDLVYSTDTSDDNQNLKIIDFFFELLNGKPVEVFDRITVKELDFYIRSNRSIPAFPFYSQEHFEIVSIGKKIYNHIAGKSLKKTIFYDLSRLGSYSDLSFSEQIEYFEEFCSVFIYPMAIYKEVDLTICDIGDNDIVLEGRVVNNLLKKMEAEFNREFQTKYTFKTKA